MEGEVESGRSFIGDWSSLPREYIHRASGITNYFDTRFISTTHTALLKIIVQSKHLKGRSVPCISPSRFFIHNKGFCRFHVSSHFPYPKDLAVFPVS